MTLLTASDTIWEWNSRLQHNTVKLEKWQQQSSEQQQPKAEQDSDKEMGSTHLRCRSMLAALSNMAVGLAIFLPTACAKGWRAPWKRDETQASQSYVLAVDHT